MAAITLTPGAAIEALASTPAALAQALAGRRPDDLARRPAPDAWSPTEVVCHLRDVEELFEVRFLTILALDEPSILVLGASAADLAPWRIAGRDTHPLDPDGWAHDRQYRRQDPHEALRAFARRRERVVALLGSLSADEWQRGGRHLSRGRLTLLEWAGSLVGHDDNHGAQLRRALDGRP